MFNRYLLADGSIVWASIAPDNAAYLVSRTYRRLKVIGAVTVNKAKLEAADAFLEDGVGFWAGSRWVKDSESP